MQGNTNQILAMLHNLKRYVTQQNIKAGLKIAVNVKTNKEVLNVDLNITPEDLLNNNELDKTEKELSQSNSDQLIFNKQENKIEENENTEESIKKQETTEIEKQEINIEEQETAVTEEIVTKEQVSTTEETKTEEILNKGEQESKEEVSPTEETNRNETVKEEVKPEGEQEQPDKEDENQGQYVEGTEEVEQENSPSDRIVVNAKATSGDEIKEIVTSKSISANKEKKQGKKKLMKMKIKSMIVKKPKRMDNPKKLKKIDNKKKEKELIEKSRKKSLQDSEDIGFESTLSKSELKKIAAEEMGNQENELSQSEYNCTTENSESERTLEENRGNLQETDEDDDKTLSESIDGPCSVEEGSNGSYNSNRLKYQQGSENSKSFRHSLPTEVGDMKKLISLQHIGRIDLNASPYNKRIKSVKITDLHSESPTSDSPTSDSPAEQKEEPVSKELTEERKNEIELAYLTNKKAYYCLTKIQSHIRKIFAKKMLKTLKERRTRRGYISKEVLTSEKAYIESLQLCLTHFGEPMKSFSYIDVMQHKALFANLEFILNFNMQLYNRIKERIEKNWENEGQRLGDIFVEMGTYLKVYTTYINTYNNSLKVYRELSNNNKFKEFCAKMKENPILKGKKKKIYSSIHSTKKKKKNQIK